MLILCKAQAYRRSLSSIPTGGCLSFPPKPFFSISVHEKGGKDARSLKSRAISTKDLLVQGAKMSLSLQVRQIKHPWEIHLWLDSLFGAKHCKRKENIYSLCHWNSFAHGKIKESCSVCVVWVFDEWIGILTVWGWKCIALLPQETVSVPLSFCLSLLCHLLSLWGWMICPMPVSCSAIYRADWQLLQNSYSVQFNVAQLNTTLYTTYLHTPKKKRRTTRPKLHLWVCKGVFFSNCGNNWCKFWVCVHALPEMWKISQIQLIIFLVGVLTCIWTFLTRLISVSWTAFHLHFSRSKDKHTVQPV